MKSDRRKRSTLMLTMSSRNHRRKGSTLIEFALVLIPVLSLVFGGIEMDRMLLASNALDNAARAGVRYAVVRGVNHPTTVANVGTVVQTFAGMGIIHSSSMTVSASCSAVSTGTSAVHVCYPTDNHIGSAISVSVAYVYDPLTSFFPLSVTLRSTAKGTIAF